MRNAGTQLIKFSILCLLSQNAVAQNLADWMSGNHGVGFRIPGGVNMETAVYDVE
jgi:hypothetical protein